MKITLPEDISEITLNQYQCYIPILKIKDQEKQDRAKVSLFTGLSARRLKMVSIKDFNEMSQQIDKALEQGVEFQSRFNMDSIEYGFVPNLDKITGAEWGDLNKYSPNEEDDKTETLHNLMAILFRPVIKKDGFKNYDIEVYRGTAAHAERMKQTPMNIVNGALGFFLNLQNELLESIQKSTNQERKKVRQLQTILQNGDGTQPLNG